MSVFTDSPVSGAKAEMYTKASTFGWLPASVMTAVRLGYRLACRTTGIERPEGFWTAPFRTAPVRLVGRSQARLRA